MTYEECNIASYTVGNTPTELEEDGKESNLPLGVAPPRRPVALVPSFTTHHPYKQKRKKGALVSPHHNIWNFHHGPTILKLNFLSQCEGRRTPSKLITSKLS